MKLQNNEDLENNQKYYNLYNYTNLKKMSSINEILLNLIPSDLINEVLKFDAHYCCMKEIRERERKEYRIVIDPYSNCEMLVYKGLKMLRSQLKNNGKIFVIENQFIQLLRENIISLNNYTYARNKEVIDRTYNNRFSEMKETDMNYDYCKRTKQFLDELFNTHYKLTGSFDYKPSREMLNRLRSNEYSDIIIR